jgi:hypothetical protein
MRSAVRSEAVFEAAAVLLLDYEASGNCFCAQSTIANQLKELVGKKRSAHVFA